MESKKAASNTGAAFRIIHLFLQQIPEDKP